MGETTAEEYSEELMGLQRGGCNMHESTNFASGTKMA